MVSDLPSVNEPKLPALAHKTWPPAGAFPIAPAKVAQAAAGVSQLFISLPALETQVCEFAAHAGAATASARNRITAERNLLIVSILRKVRAMRVTS
jgi:hypothetical protein